MQKTLRGYLARKRHGPRIKGINKIKGLESKVKQLDSIAGQLKKDKDSSIKEINNLRLEIEAAINRIKVIYIYYNYFNHLIFFFCYREMLIFLRKQWMVYKISF